MPPINPASPQQPPQSQAPQRAQPPFGSSPATGPTENSGQKAAGIKMLGMSLIGLERSISMLGSNSEEGRKAIKALNIIAEIVPPGSVTPVDIQNTLRKLMVEQQQFGQQLSQLRQAQPQGQPQPAAGGAPPQAPPRAAA